MKPGVKKRYNSKDYSYNWTLYRVLDEIRWGILFDGEKITLLIEKM